MAFLRIKLILTFTTIVTFGYAGNQLVKGKFSNAPVKGKIFLYQYFGNSFNKYDSAVVKNGEFVFTLKQPVPRGFYQIGTDVENSSMFIIANEEPFIEGDWKKIRETVNIKNSKENDTFRQLIAYNTAMSGFEGKAKEIGAIKDQNPQEYNIKMAVLQKQYDSLNLASNTFKSGLMSSASGLYFAKVLKMFNIPETADKETFFTYSELSDDEYTRGDMLLNKLTFYLSKFGGQDGNVWKAESENLIKRFPEGSANRKLAYINLIQILYQNQIEAPKSLVSGLKTEYKSDKYVTTFLATLPKGEPQEGDAAPDIILEDLNGKKVSLSSLKGKYVLIDFWASWCGPCRMENPNVVNTYNKYKDKGFTIFSVSLDNNKLNWTNAIQKDGLLWPYHVSDLKGWLSEGAALYSVHAIPATFLLDKNGVIIAKNLRGVSLEKKLSELIP